MKRLELHRVGLDLRCPEHDERLDFVGVMGTQAFMRCPRFDITVSEPECRHEIAIACGRLTWFGYSPAEPFIPAWVKPDEYAIGRLLGLMANPSPFWSDA